MLEVNYGLGIHLLAKKKADLHEILRLTPWVPALRYSVAV